MAKRLYVGNLPFNVSETDLRTLFEEYGKVQAVELIIDHETGRFRGFGLVEMDAAKAGLAVSELDGRKFGGRILRVSEIREQLGGRQ